MKIFCLERDKERSFAALSHSDNTSKQQIDVNLPTVERGQQGKTHYYVVGTTRHTSCSLQKSLNLNLDQIGFITSKALMFLETIRIGQIDFGEDSRDPTNLPNMERASKSPRVLPCWLQPFS